MTIDEQTLSHIASLAHLEFKEQEKDYYLKSFNNLMSVLDKLQNVSIDSDVSDKLGYPTIETREDKVDAICHPESFQAHAPKTLHNFYIVPKVIEGERS